MSRRKRSGKPTERKNPGAAKIKFCEAGKAGLIRRMKPSRFEKNEWLAFGKADAPTGRKIFVWWKTLANAANFEEGTSFFLFVLHGRTLFRATHVKSQGKIFPLWPRR